MTDTNAPAHVFFERPYPSANAILLLGPAPTLIDPGFGSDVDALIAWLAAQDVSPEQLALIVNTHYHSDHVGANHVLQQQYGIPIAAHVHDADLVNRRDARACAAEWLRQPVESYVVDRSLVDGDTIDTGSAIWRVVHTPGHTAGHISLFDARTRALVVGDAVHATDVGWLNPSLEGSDVVNQSLHTIERLRSLESRVAFSGHGAMIPDPSTAFDAAERRFRRWSDDPEAAAWHAAKRIFAYALMIEGGISRDRVPAYLDASPWIYDFAKAPFNTTPSAFAETLLREMLRSGAIVWRDDRLVAATPHRPTDPSWPRSPTLPSAWESGAIAVPTTN